MTALLKYLDLESWGYSSTPYVFVNVYYQELIIEERESNCAMGYQKCGPKVHRLRLSLQERGVDTVCMY